jgi:predicted lipid-binding transport protein (Tim44 family)
MLRNGLRSLFAVLAVTAMVSMVAGDADARARISAGSRGSRTFQAPATTATAPKTAAPIERSSVQPGAATAARPGAAPATGGFLNRPGILGGLAAGFIGAGLFGLLFGHGLAGGLGGIASMLGLLLQLAIVAFVARLAWNWWQRRNQPAYAAATPLQQSMSDGGRSGFPGFGGFGGNAPPAQAPLQVKPEDFDTFERLLGEVMTAYGKEDKAALGARVTPEMLSYYSEEMAKTERAGDANPISDVKLLQGDLSEAWREGQEEYATVAMRFSLNDRMVERASGRLIEQLPSEATELWTFRRVPGSDWQVSAIQQTA